MTSARTSLAFLPCPGKPLRQSSPLMPCWNASRLVDGRRSNDEQFPAQKISRRTEFSLCYGPIYVDVIAMYTIRTLLPSVRVRLPRRLVTPPECRPIPFMSKDLVRHTSPLEAVVITRAADIPPLELAPRQLFEDLHQCPIPQDEHNQEFIEMCWSVLMTTAGGLSAKTEPEEKLWSSRGRPADQEDVARDCLGFDTEKRTLGGGMECLEVSNVKDNGLAARHGVQVEDLVLAIDGKHLLASSESSFWLEIYRRIAACDSEVSAYRHVGDGYGAAAGRSSRCQDFPEGLANDNFWLRVLIVRKRPATFQVELSMPQTEGNKQDGLADRVVNVDKERAKLGKAASVENEKVLTRAGTEAGTGDEADLTSEEESRLDMTTGNRVAGEREQEKAGTKKSGAEDGGTDLPSRPEWWDERVDDGAYFSTLKLRPASMLPDFDGGGKAAQGAFLSEDLHLGTSFTVPAGSKLIAVDDVKTASMDFEQAMKVALGAGKSSNLVFD